MARSLRSLLGCVSPHGHDYVDVTKVKFDCDLEEVSTNGQLPQPLVDLLVHIARDGIRTVGLFRRPGNPNDIRVVIKRLTDGRRIVFNNYNFFTLASVVKNFLLRLPNGLLGAEYEQRCLDVVHLDGEDCQLDAINRILMELPLVVQRLLVLLLGTWYRISDHAEINHMNSYSLAVSIMGSLFPQTLNRRLSDVVTDAIEFCRTLIDNFPVRNVFPAFLIDFFCIQTNTKVIVQERGFARRRSVRQALIHPNSLCVSAGDNCCLPAQRVSRLSRRNNRPAVTKADISGPMPVALPTTVAPSASCQAATSLASSSSNALPLANESASDLAKLTADEKRHLLQPPGMSDSRGLCPWHDDYWYTFAAGLGQNAQLSASYQDLQQQLWCSDDGSLLSDVLPDEGTSLLVRGDEKTANMGSDSGRSQPALPWAWVVPVLRGLRADRAGDSRSAWQYRKGSSRYRALWRFRHNFIQLLDRQVAADNHVLRQVSGVRFDCVRQRQMARLRRRNNWFLADSDAVGGCGCLSSSAACCDPLATELITPPLLVVSRVHSPGTSCSDGDNTRQLPSPSTVALATDVTSPPDFCSPLSNASFSQHLYQAVPPSLKAVNGDWSTCTSSAVPTNQADVRPTDLRPVDLCPGLAAAPDSNCSVISPAAISSYRSVVPSAPTASELVNHTAGSPINVDLAHKEPFDLSDAAGKRDDRSLMNAGTSTGLDELLQGVVANIEAAANDGPITAIRADGIAQLVGAAVNEGAVNGVLLEDVGRRGAEGAAPLDYPPGPSDRNFFAADETSSLPSPLPPPPPPPPPPNGCCSDAAPIVHQ